MPEIRALPVFSQFLEVSQFSGLAELDWGFLLQRRLGSWREIGFRIQDGCNCKKRGILEVFWLRASRDSISWGD